MISQIQYIFMIIIFFPPKYWSIYAEEILYIAPIIKPKNRVALQLMPKGIAGLYIPALYFNNNMVLLYCK